MPKEDTQLEGHKFPFNACEILCSENGLNLTRLLDTREEKPAEEEKKEEEKEEEPAKDEEKPEEDKPLEEEKKEELKTEEEKPEEEKKEDVKPEDEEKKEETPKEEPAKEEPPKEEEKKDLPSLSDENPMDEDSDKNPEDKDEDNENKEEEEETCNYPLMNRVLDYLFSFLDIPPADDNYVLMGYFGKIVGFLFGDNKNETIMKYLLETRKDVVKRMIPHIDRKAIGSIIESFIQSIYEFDPTYGTIKDFDQNKSVSEVVEILLDALIDKQTPVEGIEVICETLTNAIIASSKDKFMMFITDETISKKFQQAVSVLTKDENPKRGTYIVKMLNKINDCAIKDIEKKVTPSFAFDEAENEILSIIRTIAKRGQQTDYQKPWNSGGENIFYQSFEQFSKFLEPIVVDIIEDILNYKINPENSFVNSWQNQQTRIEMKTLFEWEYIRSVLDIIVNEMNEDNGDAAAASLTKIMTEKNIFIKMVEMYQAYPNCNMFQNVFNQIISVVVNKYTPEAIVENLLNKGTENDLVKILMESIMNKNQFIYDKSQNKMNNLNFSNDIDALKMISTSENEKMQELIKEGPLDHFYALVVKQMSENFKKKLLYKEKTCENLYAKDDKDDDIPFSVVSIREIFEFRQKIYNMYKNGEDYETEEKNEEERIMSLMAPPEVEPDEEGDDVKNSDLFEGADFNDENEDNDRCSGNRDEVVQEDEPEQKEPSTEESEYNDLNYWNNDPENLGVGDEVLKDLDLD